MRPVTPFSARKLKSKSVWQAVHGPATSMFLADTPASSSCRRFASTRSRKSFTGSSLCPGAAAVILYQNGDPMYRIRGLRDSKLLPAERREELALLIRERSIAWAIAAVDSARIDQINIYHASRLAMLRAVQHLAPAAGYLLVDAVRLDCELPQQPIIHGDALSASIAAASIIAKVERDRMISAWDPVYPMYGLASNKGYCTARHLAALREHGPSPLHRQSFAPVWSAPIPQDVLAFMLEEPAAELIKMSS